MQPETADTPGSIGNVGRYLSTLLIITGNVAKRIDNDDVFKQSLKAEVAECSSHICREFNYIPTYHWLDNMLFTYH